MHSLKLSIALSMLVGLVSVAQGADLGLTRCRVDSVTGSTTNFGSLQVSQCEEMMGRDMWSLEMTRKSVEGISGVRDLALHAMTHGLRVDVQGDVKSKSATVDSLTVRGNPLQ